MVLILDPNGVCTTLGLEQSRETAAAMSKTRKWPSPTRPAWSISAPAPGVDKVLPLSNIARIETVPCERIEQSNGMMLMHHQGRLMPIVAAAHDVMVKEGDNTVFVISPHGEPFGLLVDSIVDIIEEKLDVEIGGDSPGVIGAADINGKVVELLDIAYFIEILQPSQAGARPKDRKSRLLLVDDAAFFRDMLAATLQASGFEVVKAGSGAPGDRLRHPGPPFRVVLIDVELPDVSGFELAARLREAGTRAAMIAIAPYATREISRDAKAAGMAAAVGKFQRNQMIDLIRACVEQKSETDREKGFATGVAA